uniref:DNA_pol_B_exo1 domain-containing protein n=1 Tax=Syphacia muris TaxID=451379 RepID=A0A0N5AWK5_9BILA
MSNVTIRNVFCDFYIDKSNIFSKQIDTSADHVPIIRIFGILESGQKCCVHVHGVFPYFLIGFDTDVSQQLVNELDSVINGLLEGLNFGCNREKCSLYKTEIIKAKSIYGYHKNVAEFIKVSFFSPYHRNKLVCIIHTLLHFIFYIFIPYIIQTT